MSTRRLPEHRHSRRPASQTLLIAALTSALSILIGCGGSAPVATTAQPASASAQPSAVRGPDIQILGLGRGHSECELTGDAWTFVAGDPIVAVSKAIPPLAEGTRTTVRLERDGRELSDFRGTITATEPSPCVWVDLDGLTPGRYRLEIAVDPSAMPPMRAEFEVTSAAAGASSPNVDASASAVTSPATSTPDPTRAPEPTPTPDPDPEPGREPVYQALEEVEVGQCYMSIDDADDGTTLAVQLVQCSERHTSEAFLVEQLEAGAGERFPGFDEIERQVGDVCGPAFEAYVGIAYERSRLEYIYFAPDEESWAAGDRLVMCVIERKDEVVEGSAKGSRE